MSRRRHDEKDKALELLEKAREGKIDMEQVAINSIAQDGFDDIDDIDIEEIKKEKFVQTEDDVPAPKRMVQQKLVIEGKINPEIKEMIEEKTGTNVSKEPSEQGVKVPKKFIMNVPKKIDIKPNVIQTQNLDFFYIDLVTVPEMKGCAFLIGKVKADSGYISCTVIVKGIRRALFVEPKDEFKNKPNEVIAELKKHYNTPGAVFAESTKEMIINPEDDQENKTVLEKKILKGIQVECYFDDKELNDAGRTYKKVHQKTLTSEEMFLAEYGIFGPSWLKLNGLTVVSGALQQKTWSLREYTLDLKKVNTKTAIKLNPNTNIPPLNICSIETLCLNEEKTKKPLMVSLDVVKNVPMSHTMKAWKDDTFTFYVSELVQCGNGMKCKDQNEMILKVSNFIQQHDIDVIISHDMTSTLMPFFETIESSGKITDFSRLGRLKRTKTSVKSKENKDGTFGGKTFFSGRLLADTFILSKEFLRSEKLNDLNTLVDHFLGIKRQYNIDDLTCFSEIQYAFNDKNKIENVRCYLEENCKLVTTLCNQMNAIAMTKELTNLAGNIWSHSFFGKRAERVEYLLLHEFIKQSTVYILPDKKFGIDGSQHKKYAGGLVLEPVKDFYSDPIMLIDFKSLYPSIIMEFGVCFLNSELGGENTKVILPEIIKKLVMRRRQIVADMEKLGDKDEIKKAQLNTKQLSVKVMTNSIYGCLGFKGSRFYCQKIAEWITFQGRNILTNTCEQVSKMDIQVIYGDTDSLMVKPPKFSLNDLYRFGNDLCARINSNYKSLEIEIDAIFDKLLLLRKKRYAASMVLQNGKKKKEMKGLDVVRREWCPLSKEIGYYCIDLILSDVGLVKMKKQLEEYFKGIAEKLRSGRIDIQRLVITKGLNKDPQSYAQKIEHVAAALKSSKEYKAGDQVKYVIEKGDPTKGTIERSIPLDVVEKTTKFEPDYEYYLENQIFAPTSRLFEVFDGMNAEIRSWLGLSPSSSNYSRIAVISTRANSCDGFEIECSECRKKFTYRAYQERDGKCRCPECKKLYTSTDLVNKGKEFMDKILYEYLNQQISCSECGKTYTKSGNNAVYDDSFDCCYRNYEFSIKKNDVMEKLSHLYVITSRVLNDQPKPDLDIDALQQAVRGYLDKPCLQRGR